MNTINLSTTISLTSAEAAKQYNLETAYNDYIREFNIQLEYSSIPNGVQAPDHLCRQISLRLEKVFGSTFAYKLSQNSPLTAVNGEKLDLEIVETFVDSFTRGNDNEIKIKLVSTKLELLKTIGTYLLLLNPKHPDKTNLLTIELTNEVTIFSLS